MPEVRFPPQVQYNYTKIWRLAQRLADVPRSWTDKLKRDARAWMSFVGSQALYAAFVFDIGCSLLGYVPLVPDVEVVRHSVHTPEFAWLTISAGLSYTFLASVDVAG